MVGRSRYFAVKYSKADGSLFMCRVVLIDGYSVEADIPKIIEVKHGPGTTVIDVQPAAEKV